MKNTPLLPIIPILLLALSCGQAPKEVWTAQKIVDRALEVSGGAHYADHKGSFVLRDRHYAFDHSRGSQRIKRIFQEGGDTLEDVLEGGTFNRFVNGALVELPDTTATKYANSVNSVHYFVRLPQGLNDKAVNKELLEPESIGGKQYHKIKVTFDQEGGGDDFQDTYLYWIDVETFEVDYLAYDFHVNGGGQRFRKAYNPRMLEGIRFVDYENYLPPQKGTSLMDIGQLFDRGKLKLLSKIELTDITVEPEP